MSRILAIDGGSRESAYLILDGGRIAEFGKLDNARMIDLVQSLDYAEMAVEFPWPRGAATSYEEFQMVEWVGKFTREADRAGKPVHKVFRMREKMAVCGSAKANDAAIRAALLDLYGPQGTKKAPGPTYGISADVWSALAVAHTYVTEGESEGPALARRCENRLAKQAKKDAALIAEYARRRQL